MHLTIKATKDEIDLRQRLALRGHVPGIRHTHKDGTSYKVQVSGAWKRTTPRRHEGRFGWTKAAQRRALV